MTVQNASGVPDMKKMDDLREGIADTVSEIHMQLRELKHTVNNIEKTLGVPVVRPRP